MKEDREQLYFHFKPLVRIVRGAQRACIYDVTDNEVYVFDGRLAEVLSRSERMSLADMVDNASTGGISKHEILEGIDQMRSFGLGELISKPSYREDYKEIFNHDDYGKKGITRLEKISIQLTNACDLNCFFCNNPDINPICFPCRRESERTSHLKIKNVVELLKDARLFDCQCVRLSGGDPLLWDGDFPSLLEQAVDMGFISIEVYTPAVRFPPDLLRRLTLLKSLTWIVPFFGASATEADILSRRIGAFTDSLGNVIDLKNAGARVFVLLPTLEVNRSQIDNMLEVFARLSIPTIVYKTLDLDNKSKPTSASKKNGSNPPYSFKKTDMIRIERNIHWNPCWSFSVAINSNGQIKPCLYSDRLLGITCGQSNLRDVLRSQGLEDLWIISKDKIDICCRCEFRYGCQDCRVAAEKIRGSLYEKYPFCSYNPFNTT